MRLWSVHPSSLDQKGIVALWREGLLARKVLRGETKGYKHHPQLDRFKATSKPIAYINAYLWHVHDDAVRRGYNFNASKLDVRADVQPIPVNADQVDHERLHLAAKVAQRVGDDEAYAVLDAPVHPLFQVVDGPIEDWEVIG